jgi:protein-disulfide isomerase
MAHLIQPVNQADHIKGPFNAPLTLVEYGDYECPYCGSAYFIIKQLQEHLKNDFRFVFRNFPLKESHPYALMAADAAEAAAKQNKFWEMHDCIYENQNSLSPESLVEFAQRIHLNMDEFKKDVESRSVASKIEEDFKTGVRSGVNGTPCFFINEERYEGIPSFNALLRVLKAPV